MALSRTMQRHGALSSRQTPTQRGVKVPKGTSAAAVRLLRLACLAVLAMAGIGQAEASPTVFPTGVTIHDKAATYDDDLLFAAPDGKTHLIDIDGREIRSWPHAAMPAKIVDPALVQGKKGVVGLWLATLSRDELKSTMAAVGLVPGAAATYSGKTFGLVGWDGKVVWQWSGLPSVGAALQHHDWDALPNGDVLILSGRIRRDSRFGDRPIIDDVIYEVDQSGKVVWSWSATDHLDELGFTPQELSLVEHGRQADYLHVNDMEVIGQNRWARAGDARFAPGNIVFSSRNANVTAIIDRKSGHIVWRIGPDYPRRDPMKPETTPRPVDQISGQHDPHMIPEGLPGAGNLLMFDNQGEAGYPPVPMALLGGSRVLEIDPATKQIVWQYTAADSGRTDFTFYSPFISSVQRLPNGNTLIDEGIDGRFFQVTPAGKIVWEYVSPYSGPAPQVPAPGHAPASSNWTYRVQGVPLDWLPGTADTGPRR